MVPPALGAATSGGCLGLYEITRIYQTPGNINSLWLSPVLLPALISLSLHRAPKKHLEEAQYTWEKRIWPFPLQLSSESRLLSESKSGAGESTHEAQRLACTDFTEWGYYLNQIRDAKKPERQVQQTEEATRPEWERDNSGGSKAGRNVSSSLFVKHPPPAAAGGCFPKGLFPACSIELSCGTGAGLANRFPMLRANPFLWDPCCTLVVECPAAFPTPQPAPTGESPPQTSRPQGSVPAWHIL